jgi:hypothetical protein
MPREVKLFLDDVRDPPDATWTVVRAAEAARDLLTDPDVVVTAASLDHDLGECDDCARSLPPRGYRLVTDTCRHKMTGYDLVKWMVEHGAWPRTKPTVHSANPVGRANMAALIDRYFTEEAYVE